MPDISIRQEKGVLEMNNLRFFDIAVDGVSGGIRTHTLQVLSLSSLPIGVLGHELGFPSRKTKERKCLINTLYYNNTNFLDFFAPDFKNYSTVEKLLSPPMPVDTSFG